MTTTHTVTAEARITFDAGPMPVVTARHGILCGSRVRLSALVVRVDAVTQPDGSVQVFTRLTPTADKFHWNPDNLSTGDLRYLTLDADQLPGQCRPEHDALVATVHAVHPGLRLADAPVSVGA